MTRPQLVEARKAIAQLRKELSQSDEDRRAAEKRAEEAEARFAAAGDLFVLFTTGLKRERILAAYQRWPDLAHSAIATITGASPSYVSEVLSLEGGEVRRLEGKTGEDPGQAETLEEGHKQLKTLDDLL